MKGRFSVEEGSQQAAIFDDEEFLEWVKGQLKLESGVVSVTTEGVHIAYNGEPHHAVLAFLIATMQSWHLMEESGLDWGDDPDILEFVTDIQNLFTVSEDLLEKAAEALVAYVQEMYNIDSEDTVTH